MKCSTEVLLAKVQDRQLSNSRCSEKDIGWEEVPGCHAREEFQTSLWGSMINVFLSQSVRSQQMKSDSPVHEIQ